MEYKRLHYKHNGDWFNAIKLSVTDVRMSCLLCTWARRLYQVSSGNSRKCVCAEERDCRVACTIRLCHTASHFIVLCDTTPVHFSPLRSLWWNFWILSLRYPPPRLPNDRTGHLRRISCNTQCHFLFSFPFHDTNTVTSVALIKTFLIVHGAQFSSHILAPSKGQRYLQFFALNSINAVSLPLCVLLVPRPVNNNNNNLLYAAYLYLHSWDKLCP